MQLHCATEAAWSHRHHNIIMKYLIKESKCDSSSPDRNKIFHFIMLQKLDNLLPAIKHFTFEQQCDPGVSRNSNRDRDTPLHVAALYGRPEVVRHFISDSKCNPNIEHLFTMLQNMDICKSVSISSMNTK